MYFAVRKFPKVGLYVLIVKRNLWKKMNKKVYVSPVIEILCLSDRNNIFFTDCSYEKED